MFARTANAPLVKITLTRVYYSIHSKKCKTEMNRSQAHKKSTLQLTYSFGRSNLQMAYNVHLATSRSPNAECRVQIDPVNTPAKV